MPEKPNLNQIPAREFAFVKGKVSYSHVGSLIQGSELERDIERARSRGQYPTDRPHTRISLYDACVCDQNGTPKAEGQMSLLDQYLQASFWSSTTRPGWNFTARNTSSNLPEIGVYDVADHVVHVTRLEQGQELATDSEVICVMEVYAPSRAGWNNGLALRKVWCVGELKLRTTGLDALMAQIGITIDRSQVPQADLGTHPASEYGAPAPVAPQAPQVPPMPAPTVQTVQPMQPVQPAVPQQPYPAQPAVPPMPAAAPGAYPQAAPNPLNYVQPAPGQVDPATQPAVYPNQGGVGLNVPLGEDEGF